MKDKRKGKRRPKDKLLEPLRQVQGLEPPGTDGESALSEHRSREEYALSLIEKSFDLIVVVGRQGNTLYVSPSVESLLGYGPHEVLGSNAFEFIHPDDLAGVAGFFGDGVDRTGFSRYLTFRVRHRDGSWRYFEAVGNNLLEDPLVGGIVVNARDITERKRLAEGLREAEERYQTILDSANDAIFIHDMRSGELLYANQKMTEMYGYTLGEARRLGLEVFDRHQDPYTAKTIIELSGKAARGEPQLYEWQPEDKTGRAFWVEVNQRRARVGGRDCIISIVRDITERKQWEETLRESEERYRLIFDHTQEAIFTYGRDRKLQSVNRKVCELLGYDEDELVGRDIFELGILHQDYARRARRGLEALFWHKVARDEMSFIRKDGSILIAEITAAVIYDENGEALAITNVARDITERKRAEKRLDKLNRCLLGLGPDSLENIRNITLTSRDTLGGSLLCYCRMDKGRLHVFSSARAEEGFVRAINPEEHICHQVITSDRDTPLAIEDLAGTAVEKDPEAISNDFRSFLGYPVRLRGKTVGCLCLFDRDRRDFPQEEINFLGMLARALTIEEERLAYEESIRHFVDIASHELRTPLSIIKGYADAFQFGDLMELNEFQLDKVRIINSKADKMTKTINDLLDLSRIERGHFVIEKQEVSLEPVLQNAVGQMREKGFENPFFIEVSEGAERIRADPEKVADLLVILLDNAVSYSPPTSDVRIEAGPQDGGVVISVLDKGRGIPPKDRKTIFERFYQVEDSQHHSSTGMGLGLYIARQIVDGHGGRIWYEPREGGGSIFRFTLP